MQQLKMHSADQTAQNISQLQHLFPHCFSEGKIDFELLQQELSEHLIEGNQERYQLNWVGKREAILAANAPIAKTLRPARAESVNFDTTENLFIEGDNLDALKLLQETYLGKVKMIYIDPPYNTGNDFVYRDDFAEDKADFLVRSNQTDKQGNRLVSNPESNGRFHSDWLSMIYPRLKLARNLLADDGVIFISIDDNEQANLKRVCDEIFGEQNFVECFIWDKKNSAKGVPPKNMVVNIHEYILCYTRQNAGKLLGELRTIEGFSNPDNDPRGLWRLSNIKSTLEREADKFTIKDPNTGNEYTNYWAFSQKSLTKMILEGRVIFPKNLDGLPKQKEFFSEFDNPYMPIKSQLGWFDPQSRTEKSVDKLMESKVFLYRKPLELMKKILSQVLSNDALILDFFAGTGSSAHAVMQLNAEDGGNRKFIMVQLPEKTDIQSEAYKAGFATIAEISKERIRRAGKQIAEQNSGVDVGFRVLKVDSSNMADIFYTPQQLSQDDLFTNAIKNDRTAEDLLFQAMLDLGIALSSPIENREIQGRTVFNVADKQLIACFDEIDENLITELAEMKPQQAVFLDAKFASDSVKINAVQIFKQICPNTGLSVI
ncbi:adenine-specific DNA-methyltransferase [Bibersteinia trehalosi]|uniref:site-specific DNA-methyltransferase n=1 Tax=Bibersteinia trehalosi TaxID=47735 RepID=UPI00104C6005|nr:site-specific DNA-methyltransferase [Bibersteinia trehalosi]TCT18630.1 adenine-specific DNA-methyltransferase [Bibersteinia trehalosi]